MDQFTELLAKQKTSNNLLPLMSQLRHLHKTARNKLKRRIQHDQLHQTKPQLSDDCIPSESSEQIEDNDLLDYHIEGTEDIPCEMKNVKPKIGEYWKIKHGTHSLYAYIESEMPLCVKYFESSAKGKCLVLNDTIYTPFEDDLSQKVNPPKKIQRGRFRVFYSFEDENVQI